MFHTFTFYLALSLFHTLFCGCLLFCSSFCYHPFAPYSPWCSSCIIEVNGAIKWIVRGAKRVSLPSVQDPFESWNRALNIDREVSLHGLLELLLSGKKDRTMSSRTTSLLQSFLAHAVELLLR
ncbi:hypothetical protein ATANTOWER_031832 [Ataeniobius toweri]|uniref:Secreted protein n=1 Tax=Ataeniobius toweri TaxID=208326 RepID=A0ABU7BYV4_9TELE|nr:hypothetical protein [Ataeniobius toweri]